MDEVRSNCNCSDATDALLVLACVVCKCCMHICMMVLEYIVFCKCSITECGFTSALCVFVSFHAVFDICWNTLASSLLPNQLNLPIVLWESWCVTKPQRLQVDAALDESNQALVANLIKVNKLTKHAQESLQCAYCCTYGFVLTLAYC